MRINYNKNDLITDMGLTRTALLIELAKDISSFSLLKRL